MAVRCELFQFIAGVWHVPKCNLQMNRYAVVLPPFILSTKRNGKNGVKCKLMWDVTCTSLSLAQSFSIWPLQVTCNELIPLTSINDNSHNIFCFVIYLHSLNPQFCLPIWKQCQYVCNERWNNVMINKRDSDARNFAQSTICTSTWNSMESTEFLCYRNHSLWYSGLVNKSNS